MKKNLIEKLLTEQTTPEEEHLVAKMLQQEEDMEQWLTEDETAEYDSIVSQRRGKHRVLRWAIAAVVVALVAAGTIVLWPKEQVNEEMVVIKERVSSPQKPELEKTAAITPPIAKPITTPKKAKNRVRQPATAKAQDSLEYYIARLEKELDEVTDSINYTTKAEQIIRADARLQKLIQRIMIGELTKDDQYTESMNMTKEEQP